MSAAELHVPAAASDSSTPLAEPVPQDASAMFGISVPPEAADPTSRAPAQPARGPGTNGAVAGVRTGPVVPAPRVEPLSPFVDWSEAEREPISAELFGLERAGTFVDLLRSPSGVVERLRDPASALPLVATSMACLIGGTALFAAVTALEATVPTMLSAAVRTSLAFVLAAGASLAPIYGASILVCSRLPMARLSASLSAATAAAALLLAAQAPMVHLAFRYDREWAGPLAVVHAFLLAGLAGGKRFHDLLLELAKRSSPTGELSDADLARVGILARVAMMILGFTLTAALWPAVALWAFTGGAR